MGDIELRCVRVGMIQTNCYIVYDKEMKQAIVTDPGDNGDYIAECIEKIGAETVAVLITNGHSDHFKGLQEFKDRYKVPVYVHEADAHRRAYQGGFVEASYKLQP